MPATLETPNLKSQSVMMEDWRAQRILEWAVNEYGRRLTMATAFGPEGCVILAMLADIDADVHVFNLETGYQFAETLELRERILLRYGIDVELVQAEETVEEMEGRFGGPIYGRDPDACCSIRKVQPFHKVVAGKDAWISSIRRDQTFARSKAGIVEWDHKFNLVKINPLANWTKTDVWRYISENDVPYNSLHDQGYASIGCWPCTKPVSVGENDRAGRWAGSVKTECGLHTR
jgi:phosphoadenosine phosphosulfate reductase